MGACNACMGFHVSFKVALKSILWKSPLNSMQPEKDPKQFFCFFIQRQLEQFYFHSSQYKSPNEHIPGLY